MTRPADRSLRVLVLGGNGFIGRHFVSALLERHATVLIGSRHQRLHHAFDGLALEVVRVQLHRCCEPGHWQSVIAGVDAVINCVGILRQRLFETYDAVHHRAPAALADACAAQGIRLVHVSALGLSEFARSRFLTSKHAGEQAIFRTDADYIVARLSLLDGEGGYGARWLRGVARLPVYVVPASAKGHIAALSATDAGIALARLACLPGRQLGCAPPGTKGDVAARSRVFELGGNEALSFSAYIQGLRQRFTAAKARPLIIPGWLARLAAHLCDIVHFSPFSFGHWELLCQDNTPAPNRLPELLGRAPEPVTGPAAR